MGWEIVIPTDKIKKKLGEVIANANVELDPQILFYLNDYEGPFSQVLKENAKKAKETGLPVCQDTGFIEFFVFMGNEVLLEEPIDEILNSVVRKVYSEKPFRYSIVSDPLLNRKNTGDNTPAVCHLIPVRGSKLEIRFLIKGGGSENLSRLFMLNPTATVEDVVKTVVDSIRESGARGCPPLKLGIGIGGSSDKAMMLSKLALTRSFDEKNADPGYADLEERILREVNELKIGYQGLGVGISAYSVHIETFPTHIAILPVGLTLDCYITRRGRITLEDQ